jgi:hypothetical protein
MLKRGRRIEFKTFQPNNFAADPSFGGQAVQAPSFILPRGRRGGKRLGVCLDRMKIGKELCQYFFRH